MGSENIDSGVPIDKQLEQARAHAAYEDSASLGDFLAVMKNEVGAGAMSTSEEVSPDSKESDQSEKFTVATIEKTREEYFEDLARGTELDRVDNSLDGGRYYAALKDDQGLFDKYADGMTENALKRCELEVEKREKRLAGGFYREAAEAAGLGDKYRDLEPKSVVEQALAQACEALEKARSGFKDPRINDMSVVKEWLENGAKRYSNKREAYPDDPDGSIEDPQQLLNGVSKAFEKNAESALNYVGENSVSADAEYLVDNLSESEQMRFTEGVMEAALENKDGKTAALAIAIIESIRELDADELENIKESVMGMGADQKKEFISSYDQAKKEKVNFKEKFDRIIEARSQMPRSSATNSSDETGVHNSR